ncbi:hypothetical protein [Selenomonas sp. AB3002]|uniref:hypothetical protein n=1 Tax=Selenomonas sp. AB3002 TaxID=1392502 RepID=UPI000496AC22
MALAKIKLTMRDEETPPKIEFEGEHRHLIYLLGVMVFCMAEEAKVHILDIIREIGVSVAVIAHKMEDE